MKKQKTSAEREEKREVLATISTDGTTAATVDTMPSNDTTAERQQVMAELFNSPGATDTTITDDNRRAFDKHLKRMFKLSPEWRRIAIFAVPMTIRFETLLHDAVKRGSFRASSYWLEYLHPELSDEVTPSTPSTPSDDDDSEAVPASVGTITDTITEPAISKAQHSTKGKHMAKRNHHHSKALKPVTAKQQRFIDKWLIKAFDLNDFDHLRLLARLPNSIKLYRQLHDAEKRGNWRASALHLEIEHPETWAPRLKNILFTDLDIVKMYSDNIRKAGEDNGKAK